jgi:hypothetical protein
MRETPRKRRHVPSPVIHLLFPFFRFSDTRSAYVLRGVGGRHGPVLTGSATSLTARPGR